MPPLTDSDVAEIKRVYHKCATEGMGERGSCVVYAGITTAYLHKKGVQAVIAAGSASFPCAEDISGYQSRFLHMDRLRGVRVRVGWATRL